MAEARVSDLIRDIQLGEFTLPEFQRGYVWNRQQVRGYLNSLYRNYPTGSFLIWKTPHPPKLRGDIEVEEHRFYQLVLDGQQRLTSLYALIVGSPPPFYEGETLFFSLHFNVVSEEFKYYKASEMKDRPEWIPVTNFFKQGLAAFLQGVAALEPTTRDFYYANMPKLTALDRIKDYLYHLQTLNETRMDRVVEIFNLVNSSGTELSKSDLALAHICSLWPEAREEFRGAQRRFAELKFAFGLDFFTRCTTIVATGSALYEPLYKTSIERVQTAWPKVTKALEYVLNVLRGDAYIDDADTFPSQTVLLPLVAFLAMTGRAHFDSDAQKKSFLHWMYAAMMWGRYSGSSETKLQSDVEALKEEDPPVRLRENLIADRGRIKVEAKDLEGAGAQSPFFPMAYVVARSRGAGDWGAGTALDQEAIGQSFGLEVHHVFPQSLLYKSKFDSSDRSDKRTVNEIANLVFLTKQANLGISNKKPANYLPKVLEKYPDALKQQCVPHGSGLWELESFEAFLSERRRLMADAINAFMDALLQPASREGFTIGDFIAKGEGPTLEFKASLRWDYKRLVVNKELEKVVVATLAGFMNHRGGTVVLGATDDGAIVGVEADFATLPKKPTRDGLSNHLSNVLTEYLGETNAALVETIFAALDEKTVMIPSAPASTIPVFVHDGNEAEFHVRVQA
ncbi:MAG: GmrSD restriction endonuclease domain-containing protein, partial [Acidobacteriota bacterium]